MELQAVTAYASTVLFVMGCFSLILAVLFRSKFKKLEELSSAELSANVYSKTFVIFDPYEGSRKIINSYLPLWALVVGFFSFTVSLAFFVLANIGFGLSILAALTSLNLIVMDGAFDVYKSSKIFADAINKGSGLGVGDLKVFFTLKVCTRRLGYYYLGVAVFLAATSLSLPHILNQVMLVLALFMAEIARISSVAGFANWQLAVFLFPYSSCCLRS
ncbi:MAG: hypothetical protein QW667_04870 [Candidatus Bathyarchaeia archaeon]